MKEFLIEKFSESGSLRRKLLRITMIMFLLLPALSLTAEKNSPGTVDVFKAVQQRSITGTVTDSKGEPLIGVTILVKGSIIGALTDVSGKYVIQNVPADAILVFSFVGLETKEILVTDLTVVNVVLSEGSLSLDEVVVIGYGTANRRDFTGSVSSIKMDGSPLSSIPSMNALESLKGNIAGLNIGVTNTAGGEPSMLIRGQNSISGTNNPLIVVDGIIYLGSISDINPNDIASYDILKDAVSSAAYGSRSSNGVISITTKKGTTAKPLLTFSTSSGVQLWQNKPDLYDGEGWLRLTCDKNMYPQGSTSWIRSDGELANLAAGHETDWLSEATHTGIIQDYQLAISGVGQNVNYYLSTSYNKNRGIVKGDDYTRISILAKVNTSILNWLKVGVDAGYSNRDYSGFSADIGRAQQMPPYAVNFRDDLGNLEKWPYEESLINPMWGVDDMTSSNLDIRENFRLNTYAIVDIPWVKGLSFKINLLGNLNKNHSGNFFHEDYYVTPGKGLARYEPTAVIAFLMSANGNITFNDSYSYVMDNILNYKNTFKKHTIEATLVATRDSYTFKEVNSTGQDFATNGNTVLGMWGIHKATIQKVNLDDSQNSNIGYLGRFNYSFNDKYYFTSSYRRDGASVFGVENKWANFVASGIAWRISNEEFLKSFQPLSDLKLKLSWGQNGNQGLNAFGTLSTVINGTSSAYQYEFSNAPGKINYGLYQNTIGNQELGWEKTTAWNAGFESTWLNRRISIDLDTYFSKTTDQIFVRNIPVMTGFQTIKTSMGQVNNSGIELTVRSVNIKTSDLSWITSVTFWKNYNKLVTLYGTDNNNDGKEDDDIANSLFIGKSLGTIYGYEFDGIVQVEDTEYIALTGATPGFPKYKDIDGVAGISAGDRRILGCQKENFRLNMSNSIKYKGIELYVMAVGAFGGNDYFLKQNEVGYMCWRSGRYNENSTVKPYWTAENRNNVYPAAFFTGDNRFLGLQSRAFVRIQDVSLSYSFDQPWIKTANITSLRVFASVQNLTTFTKWIGGDPEIGTTINSNTTFPSTYSVGLNVSF